jgi:hypothetical protein
VRNASCSFSLFQPSSTQPSAAQSNLCLSPSMTKLRVIQGTWQLYIQVGAHGSPPPLGVSNIRPVDLTQNRFVTDFVSESELEKIIRNLLVRTAITQSANVTTCNAFPPRTSASTPPQHSPAQSTPLRSPPQTSRTCSTFSVRQLFSIQFRLDWCQGRTYIRCESVLCNVVQSWHLCRPIRTPLCL